MLSSSSLSAQANEFAKNVMSGKGLNFSAPLISQPFQAVTASAFSKLIEVDVNTHQMYLYDNGNLTRSYPISAGAPATPTPIGEFHVWEKLTEQTMTGFNTNGTRYVQPNVQWINYFDHSGDAVHGNYWRPLSVFGNVNTSHGCVSLPNAEAEWVYDWAPIGTTVITHN
jgi:lipoprotein-anchoring transpeptidase ErfK/SrfK